jgi:hypothetical protein
MGRVDEEIKRLRAELDDLQARVKRDAEDDTKPETVVDARPGRRQLLTKVAGGAAAAVVGGTALAIGQASPAAAAAGTFDGDPAVTGTGTGATSVGVEGIGGAASGGLGVSGKGGIGVLGEGQFSWGLYGTGVSGVSGNSGNSPGTWGTRGFSQNGFGAAGVSPAGVGLVSEVGLEGMHLRLGGNDTDAGTKPPLTSSKPWLRGDIARDINGDLWLCVQPGTPGQWRRLAGPTTAGSLVPLPSPVRVYDSRSGQLPATGPKNPLAANTARTLDLKNNSSGVPAGATAVLVSLVATGTTTNIGGFMAIFRNGIAWPGTSNLNWSGANQTVAVTTLTAVDQQARADVYAGSVTDVVVDVLGYYL